MTDAQWDDYCKPLVGLRVRWTGWVDGAKDYTSYGELLVDMDPPEEVLRSYDVSFRIPKSDILKYNKDQKITFEGDIQNLDETLFETGIRVKPENALVLE